MVIVGKHINDITINPLEHLLDDTGNVMEFENKQAARKYLWSKGFNAEDMYWLVFEEISEQEA